MLAEEAERSSRSGWESRGKGHSLTLQLVRVQASMRVAKGLDKGQEQHRCTDREARGNPLLSRRSAAPPLLLLGKPALRLPARRQLGGCGCARLAKWRLCSSPAGCCCAREGGGEGGGGGRDVKVGQECN